MVCLETEQRSFCLLGLKNSQNPAWDLDPRDWDLNIAKSHGTCFQNLMKLRFSMSSQKEFSERQRDFKT